MRGATLALAPAKRTVAASVTACVTSGILRDPGMDEPGSFKHVECTSPESMKGPSTIDACDSAIASPTRR